MTLVDSAFNLGPSKYESKLQNANLTAEKSFSSVVIPTYNRSKSLIRTLKAIYNQNLLPHEVIVVDDHSSDETTEICLKILSKKLPFSLIYLRQKYNLGPAAARNMGVMNAKNDLILFTDDDCEPDPSWVFELTKKATQSPEYAGVGGPVLSAKKDKIGLFFDYHRMLDPKFIDSHPIYLVTANAAYRRDWILKVGGFNEGLNHPGGEDPGLSFKISSAGGKFCFAPRAIVKHHYPSRYKSIVKMFYNYGYGGCHVALANTNL